MMRQISLLILILICLNLSCSKREDEAKSSASKDFWRIEGKIAFGTSRDGHPFGIAVYDQGEIKRVSENGNDPIWSADGSKLLIALGDDIGIIDLASGQTKKIKCPVHTVGRTWASNENKILISGYDNSNGIMEGLKQERNLFLYNLDNDSWEKITDFAAPTGFDLLRSFKDGERVLCSFAKDLRRDGDRGTYIYNLRTKEMEKIIEDAGEYAFLPDEKSFLINTALRDDQGKIISMNELFLVDIETGKKTLLTKTGTMKSRPTVSPDGKKVLYSAFVPVGDDETAERIFMLDLETKIQGEIFDRNPGYKGKIPHDRSPDWHA